ncbi:hypothetical protein FJZ33_11315, partial [Candidatus Poribacteria bacterium]|nr:hypothetical protein [Candidatus Poribacteria bacterium]
LLHDVGKPAVKTIDEKGQIRFFGHNTKGAESMLDIGLRLRLANREIAYLEAVINEHIYLLGLLPLMRKPENKKEKDRAIRRFIQKNEEELISILLISYADLQATQGELRLVDDLEMLNKLIDDIANTYFQKSESHLPRLITGDEIMAKFSLSASPIIGKILDQLEEARLNESIKTKDDAIKFIGELLKKN